MHPVGPSSPTTYWLRRVLVVVLAVAALVGVVWYLANRTSRSSAGSETAPVVNSSAAPTLTGVLANSTAPSRSTVPSPSPSPTDASPTASGSPTDSAAPTDPAATDPAAPTDAPATDPGAATAPPAGAPTDAAPTEPTQPPAEPAPPADVPPPPSYDADGKLLCADASIGLTAIVPAEVRTGTNVIIGVTVANTGAEACRRDVSGAQQVFTVFAADGTRLWSTADCFPGQGTEIRDLAPGQTLEYTVKWSGKTSAPGCTGDRAAIAPGSYTLVAQIGGLASPPATFTIV